MDRPLQIVLEATIIEAQGGFERGYHIADDVFRCVMQQGHQPVRYADLRVDVGADIFDNQAVLGDGKAMFAKGLSVPARNARQPQGDVVDLDIDGRRIEQVQPPSGEHTLPGARG